MSSKNQYKEYARNQRKHSDKLKIEIGVLEGTIRKLKLNIIYYQKINFTNQQVIQDLKRKIKQMNFWRDLFRIK